MPNLSIEVAPETALDVFTVSRAKIGQVSPGECGVTMSRATTQYQDLQTDKVVDDAIVTDVLSQRRGQYYL